MENERRLLEALTSTTVAPQSLEFLTEDWYAGITARLHLNAFCLERIDELDAEDLLVAATAFNHRRQHSWFSNLHTALNV
jgi:hypothetical protein